MNAYPPLPGDTGTPVSAPPQFVIEHLARTCSWARAVSVLVLLLILISVALALFAPGPSPISSSAPMESLLFLVKLVLSVLAFVRLGMYASAIKRLMVNRRAQDLVDSMLQQKLFWKIMGILMIIYLLQVGYIIATSGLGSELFGRM